MSYKIMVVEDDENIAKLLGEHIERYGYETCIVKDFDNVLEIFKSEQPHLVLMDINLPKFDGYFWCNKIRSVALCPIIFISARDSELSQVMAIENGADDFITKPFYYDVVLAKIKGQLRRVYGEYAQNAKSAEKIFDVYGLKLYPERMELLFNDKKLEISKKECDVLEVLMKKYPKVVSREALFEKLWDESTFVDDNTLNVNVTRVRKRLNEIGIEEGVETVRGAGYRLKTTWRE